MRASLLTILAVALLGACKTKTDGPKALRTCEATVTRGNGNFKAALPQKPKETEDAHRRRVRRAACRSLCAAKKDPKLNACTARCVVDIDAKKAGALVSCTTAPAK